MKTWKIPVIYSMHGIIEVVSDTLEEAMDLAGDKDNYINLPANAKYIEDSWDLATYDEKHIREFYNHGQEDEK